MVSSRIAISAAVALFCSVPSTFAATARGLAWATDSNFAPTIGSLPLITWYHHWQDGKISQMPSKNEFVPMFWGPSKWDLWNKRKAEMNKSLPKHLIGFNEADISSQANMDPSYAAQVWMQEIQPFGNRGVNLVGPSVAYNLDWYDTFLKAIAKKGGYVNEINLHWYGSWKDLNGFKSYVKTAHSRFGKNIWITELGITTASGGSQQDIKNFMMNAYAFMDSTGYVSRASWFGCFESNDPPDNYATGKNALFKGANKLSDMGYWYGYSSHPDRRRDTQHSRIAARLAAENSTISADDDSAIHCDDICELRKQFLTEPADD